MFTIKFILNFFLPPFRPCPILVYHFSRKGSRIAFDDEIDYSIYDTNKDDILDTFVLNVPMGGDSDFWYGCQATWCQKETLRLTIDDTLYTILCMMHSLRKIIWRIHDEFTKMKLREIFRGIF